jgi:hypothetical protein
VERPRALAKREVEVLLAAVAGHEAHTDDAAAVAAEVAALVDALRGPLARATGAPAGLPWPDLVERAAAVGGWDATRRAAVGATAADADARAALWDLVAELNEVRGLERPAR